MGNFRGFFNHSINAALHSGGYRFGHILFSRGTAHSPDIFQHIAEELGV
jgi:hypothetical protein